MQSRIVGTTLPVLEFILEPNESVVSEAGELSWMSSSIQMQTHTQFAGGGGFFGAFKRVVGGGSLFMTEYRAMGARGEIAFATRFRGIFSRSKLAREWSTSSTGTGFSALLLRLRLALVFSSRWARACSAEMVFCCRKSPGKALVGSSCLASWW